jgi:dihydropyrimidinase
MGDIMEYDLVISGGTLIKNGVAVELDVGISGGLIGAVGRDLKGRRHLDATSKLVIPGGIDPHVHLEMPTPVATSSDDWFTGTRAAACGGTTTVIDFIEAMEGESLLHAFESRRSLADGRAVIDYGLHMTLSRADPDTLEQIPAVIAAGLTSFKCYTTYAMRLDDAQLLAALVAVGKAGGLTIVHAESDAIVNYLRKTFVEAGFVAPKYHPLSRPAAAEGEAVERVLALAEAAEAPVYFVHVSTERGAEAIARAQGRQQTAYGETCPQYLVLTDDCFDIPGFEGAKYVCSPPLRKTSDQGRLWRALAEGELQTIGTDHCPFFYHGTKNLGHPLEDPPPFTQIPGGIPGIEARLALMYTFGVRAGRLSVGQWVDACSTGPARMFGLYPRKGSLEVGADADIVIFDPDKSITLTSEVLHENVDYTPYEGFELGGYPVLTLARGRILVQDGEHIGGDPGGRFIPRNPFSTPWKSG